MDGNHENTYMTKILIFMSVVPPILSLSFDCEAFVLLGYDKLSVPDLDTGDDGKLIRKSFIS